MSLVAPPERPATSEPALHASGISPLRRWIIDHDQSWLFTFGYVGLALVLSIWISLFWLVFVVLIHGVLEWIRQSHADPRPTGVMARVAWELKLDAALILFALALSAYMDVVLGLTGLGGAAKLAQAGTRAAGWTKAIRGALLSVDDAAQIARALFKKSGPSSGAENPNPFCYWGGWNQKWSRGNCLTLVFGLLCIILILIAPLLTHHDFPSLCATLASDLHPWP
jgi:hypothetical protein